MSVIQVYLVMYPPPLLKGSEWVWGTVGGVVA